MQNAASLICTYCVFLPGMRSHVGPSHNLASFFNSLRCHLLTSEFYRRESNLVFDSAVLLLESPFTKCSTLFRTSDYLGMVHVLRDYETDFGEENHEGNTSKFTACHFCAWM